MTKRSQKLFIGLIRRWRRVDIALAVLLFVPAIVFAQSTVTELPGLVELKKGEYENALKLLSAHLAANPTDASAQRYLLRVYAETGRYADAEAAGKKFLLKNPDAGTVRFELAEVLATTGRYAEASSEFERAGSDLNKSHAPDAERLNCDLRRAEVLDQTGQDVKAKEIYQALEKYYYDNVPQEAPELTAVARALVHLEKFQDANDTYLAAIRVDPSYFEAHLFAGELFTSKYNYGEAAQFLQEALRLNPNSARALLDVAINSGFAGGDEMDAALSRALAINPNHVPALVFKAGLALESDQYEGAAAELDKAFKINPRSLDAHALRASMLYLQDRDVEPEVAATLAINPRYGVVYNTLAHFATITRRTAQSAQFARRAIEIAPALWAAHLNLGMALLRTGQMEEGRAEVEKAFAGDPFNVWAKNTLDLLDTMKDFRETRQGPFIIKSAAKESDTLSPYAAELLNEAVAKLTAKYRFTPQAPITIEIFANHEDFAVRALGLPGLGALGVCFGPVVALDSPSAREVSEFNWGSTLWHEFTHVITLQMTDYRVPRWFTEGLSVYEERRARPGWGGDWNPVVLRALAAGQWFKISELDAAFQHPANSQDVPLAYFEASQVCEFIADRYGFESILRMLAFYRDKARTADVLRQVLKLSETEFDQAFMAYIETKTRPWQKALKTDPNLVAKLSKDDVLKMLTAEETFALRMRAAQLLLADGDADGAMDHLKRAIELFPYYTGEDNAYEALAKILEAKGQPAQAADVLESLVAHDESNLEALKALARLRLAQGDRARALAAMKLSFYVDPFDYAMHTRAGELSLEAKEYSPALTEFQVALALQPPNVAEANYNIATAFFGLGKQPEAKRAVLRSLEAAPRYEKAQELLLKITGQ